MKKRICGIITFIKEMEGRFFLIALLCALVIFCIAAVNETSLIFVPNKEKSYQDLEEVVDNISNQKNLIQPLSESLKEYKISSNENGTVKITLYSHDYLILDVIMTEEYQIQSIERKVFIAEYLIQLFLSLMFMGIIITTVLYLVVWGIILIAEKCKKIRKKRRD